MSKQKRVADMSPEERQEEYNKWLQVTEEEKEEKFLTFRSAVVKHLLRDQVRKELAEDDYYQELRERHKYFVRERRNTWAEIKAIREETYQKFLREQEGS